MSSTIDQKAYLQKYLSGSSGEKKKKKKKVTKGTGFKIIDDDIDLSKLRPLEGDELDILGEGEDAPQIAGIIDERPEEVKKLEQFKTSSKWRVINQDDGFNSKLQIEEIKKNVVEAQKENELIFGKMYSDSEDEKKNDSDLSPPRKGKNKSKKPQNNSDSDFSPPRKSKQTSPPKKSETNYDSDLSPPRKDKPKEKADRARKPSRWADADKSKERSKSNSPRRKKRNESPVRRSKKYDSDESPPRKSKKHAETSRNDDSDLSPHRKKNYSKNNSSDKRNDRKNRGDDSDQSPPRKRKSSPHRNDKYSKNSSSKNNDRRSPDTDPSPPRRRERTDSSRRQKSPLPRRSKKQDDRSKRRPDSDSDLSPPRKERPSRVEDRHKRNSDSPPPSNKKMASKTLEGKMAGLSDAKQLRNENEAFRRREEEAFSKLADDLSGRNATAVSRKGKRETSEDRKKQKEKAERQKELDEKYKRWGKGLKQIEAQEARVQEFLHEAAKPLARHRDDRDLEQSLKQVERAGDPMLQYIRERKRERGELPPEKPVYKGNFPPNRFNIRPGYRWDGVDRSNGYEKKYFDQQSKRKAQEEEAYKWSTEDL